MTPARQTIVIVALALAAAVASAVFHPKRPAWYQVEDPETLRWRVTAEKAAELIATEPVLLVDSRTRERFEKDHLDGAILLDRAEWGELMFQHMQRLQDAMSETVIVYRDSEDRVRGDDVARELREIIGLDPVYVLQGDWRELRARLEATD